ncbi:MAG: dihydroorotate dehydrogenase electron transfer subunit [Methanobacteriota archaeon]
MNTPTVVKILRTVSETQDVKTHFFHYPGAVIPGQFYMIWIPGVDEIPMSVSYILGDRKGITFRKVGEATSALFSLKTGDLLGIRGPFGTGFTFKGKRMLFVGGGTGVAMLAPAVEHAMKNKSASTVIIGMKTKNEVFFEKRLRTSGANVLISTDDGSQGFKGFASDLAKEVLKKEKFDTVYTCGPEIMMKRVFDSSRSLPFQASLERYMKCCIGICGQCCVGEGLRVCKEGPVFDRKTLQHIPDFGVFRRDAAGRKIFFSP